MCCFLPCFGEKTLVQVTEDNFSVNLDIEYESNPFFNFSKILILENLFSEKKSKGCVFSSLPWCFGKFLPYLFLQSEGDYIHFKLCLLVTTINVAPSFSMKKNYPNCNYLFKVNNRNTRSRCEICSPSTIKTIEWR